MINAPSVGYSQGPIRLADRIAGVPASWRGSVGSAVIAAEREARVLFGFHDGMLIALHAFIKKTRATPAAELSLARQRFREATS
jgi:hypothetical protein